MIKILPLRDNEVLSKLNKKHNTTARLAYCVYDGDIIDGYALYNLNEKEGLISIVEAEEDSVYDGLVRAVFASLYDFGINRASFAKTVSYERISKLNFVKNGEFSTSSIEDILYNCKNCKK